MNASACRPTGNDADDDQDVGMRGVRCDDDVARQRGSIWPNPRCRARICARPERDVGAGRSSPGRRGDDLRVQPAAGLVDALRSGAAQSRQGLRRDGYARNAGVVSLGRAGSTRHHRAFMERWQPLPRHPLLSRLPRAASPCPCSSVAAPIEERRPRYRACAPSSGRSQWWREQTRASAPRHPSGQGREPPPIRQDLRSPEQGRQSQNRQVRAPQVRAPQVRAPQVRAPKGGPAKSKARKTATMKGRADVRTAKR
jgi:hypothetical protein